MIFNTHALILAISLLNLATASPPPAISRSTGFHIVARLAQLPSNAIITGGTKDLSPTLEGQAFVAIHTGAALSQAVLDFVNHARTRVYYLNGTAAQRAAYTTNILSDGGTPIFPWGIGVYPTVAGTASQGEETLTVNAGSGTPMSVVEGDGPYLVNGADGGKGTFVACGRYVDYYQENRTVVGYVPAGTDDLGKETYEVPDGCAMVTLVPVCAELEALPRGSLSSHEFVLEVGCYASG